jgi:hypothetical protein
LIPVPFLGEGLPFLEFLIFSLPVLNDVYLSLEKVFLYSIYQSNLSNPYSKEFENVRVLILFLENDVYPLGPYYNIYENRIWPSPMIFTTIIRFGKFHPATFTYFHLGHFNPL